MLLLLNNHGIISCLTIHISTRYQSNRFVNIKRRNLTFSVFIKHIKVISPYFIIGSNSLIPDDVTLFVTNTGSTKKFKYGK